MEESPREQPEKHVKAAPVAAAIAVLLLIYLLSPALIIYPVYRGWMRHPMDIMFSPLGRLVEISPAYGRFVVWECHLLGMTVNVRSHHP